MGFGDQSAGILMRIRSDSSQAQADINKFKSELKGIDTAAKGALPPFQNLAAQSGLTAKQFDNLKIGALAAVAGIGAIAGVAAAVGLGLFNLAKNASDYGSAIFDASQKTGLSAETLTTLKLAADSAGSSFEGVTKAISKFTILVGEATNGNDKAIATLKKFGLDPVKAANNLEGALSKAIKIVNEMGTESQQAAALSELFGKKIGADLIPVIKQLGGDLDKAKKHAEDFGLTLSKDNVQAADDLGDAVGELSQQVKIAAMKFALAYAPQITDAIKDIGKVLADNKDEWGKWGGAVGGVLKGVVDATRDLIGFLKDNPIVINLVLGSNPFSAGGAAVGYYGSKAFDQYGKGGTLFQPPPIDRPDVANDPRNPFYKPPITTGGGGFNANPDFEDDEVKKAADDAQKKREAMAKRDAAAVLKIGANALDTINDQLQKAYDALLAGLNAGGTIEAFKDKVQELIEWYNTAWLVNAVKLDKLEIANAKKGGAPKNELKLLEQEQVERAAGMTDRIIKIREAASNAQIKTEKETAAETKKIRQDDEKQTKESIDAELALFRAQSETQIAVKDSELAQKLISETEFAKQVGQIRLEMLEKERVLETNAERQKLLDEEIKRQKIKNAQEIVEAIDKETAAEKRKNDEIQRGIDKERERWEAEQMRAFEKEDDESRQYEQEQVGILGESVLTRITAAGERVTEFAGAWKALKDIAGAALQGLAQGIGNMVQNLVLMGNVGGQSMQKLVAGVLAGVAAQAAVLAVMELAYGIAALTPWGAAIYGPAPLHFKAAALFGSIALITGLAGRAVAGNAFQQQTANGGAGATGSNAQGSSSTSAGAYSGLPDQTVTQGINTPQIHGSLHIKLDLDSDGLLRVAEQNVRQNGGWRNLIIETANA